MINRKKTAAIMLGLTMSMSGTLMEAPADEADKWARKEAGRLQQL